MDLLYGRSLDLNRDFNTSNQNTMKCYNISSSHKGDGQSRRLCRTEQRDDNRIVLTQKDLYDWTKREN